MNDHTQERARAHPHSRIGLMERAGTPPEPRALTAGDFLLRPPSVDEYREVLALGVDPDVRLWNPRCQITDEVSALRDCIAGADWSDGSHTTFSIIHRDSGRYAGNIALHSIDRANSQAYVGYRIAPWTRGQGVATTAVRSLVGWGFGDLGLTRLVLTHGLENIASCRVAQKAGFALEGTRPMAKRFGDARLHDEHLHTLGAGPGEITGTRPGDAALRPSDLAL